MIGQGGFQGDSVEVGQTCNFCEDGGNATVTVKSKEVRDETMYLVLTIVEVHNDPWHGKKFPDVGKNFSVSEYRGAGAYAGWSIE